MKKSQPLYPGWLSSFFTEDKLTTDTSRGIINKIVVESAKAHATPLRILTSKFDYIESRFKNVYFRQIDTGTNPK